MDLTGIGLVRQYAKGLALKTRWNLKQQSGDINGHTASLNDYFTTGAFQKQDQEDMKMSRILSKADAGRKLSRTEMEYLRVKNPAVYEKLRAIEKEQEEYEKALKKCKSKDEAQRLHVSRLAEIMAAAKRGDSSALYRLNRMTETMTKFTASKEYKDLPTEAEQAIARRKVRKAEEEAEKALREEAEQAREETEEAAETAKETESVKVPEAAEETEVAKVPEDTEAPEDVKAFKGGKHTPEDAAKTAEAAARPEEDTGVRRRYGGNIWTEERRGKRIDRRA